MIQSNNCSNSLTINLLQLYDSNHWCNSRAKYYEGILLILTKVTITDNFIIFTQSY